MLIHLMLLLPASYAIFVFTSNLYNPFVIAKGLLRRSSWQLGRAVALASLIAGTLAIVLMDGYNLSARDALAMYLVMVGLLTTPSIIAHRKNSIWGQISAMSK